VRAPTEKEFDEWMAHPVTAYVREYFHKLRENMRQQWEGGSFTDYSRETTALVNVGNVGTCKGYAAFTELDYDDLMTEEDGNGKQVRAQALGSSSVN